MNADQSAFIREDPRLLIRIVFSDVPLFQKLQIPLFEIEVRPGNHLLASIRCYPIDNLWRIGAEEDAVARLQRFPIFACEDPDVSVLAVADVLEILFEAL